VNQTTDTSNIVANFSTSQDGGAIYNTGTLEIYGSTLIAGNYAGSGYSGGAIVNNSSSGKLTIDGVTFLCNGYNNFTYTGNDYAHGSAALNGISTAYGGAIVTQGDTTATIANSIFNNNGANQGGGFYNAGNSTITNSLFEGNIVTSQGGAIYNSGTLTIGTINQTADTSKFVNNYSTGGDGGAIYNSGGTLNIYGSVLFAGNYTASGYSGGAIFNNGGNSNTIDGATFLYNGYNNYTNTDPNYAGGSATSGGIVT